MSTTHDTNGRRYAKLSELKPGDKLVCDGGFTCMKEGDVKIVNVDALGQLFVRCEEGEHNLLGQADDGEHLIGLYKV